MRKRSQVIIVGGGPVGVGLAVDLGLRGISCALVERRVGMHKIPKGQNLAQRTLERFYFWGCVEELRAQRLLPPEVPASGVTANFCWLLKGRESVRMRPGRRAGLFVGFRAGGLLYVDLPF